MDAYTSAYNKVLALFRELAGARADALEPDDEAQPHNAARIAADRLIDALSGTYGSATANVIARDLCEWNHHAALLVALHLFPEKFTTEELVEFVDKFFVDVIPSVLHAATSGGYYDTPDPDPTKSPENLEELLRSLSESVFPAQFGRKRVEVNSHGIDGDTPLHVLVWRDDDIGADMLLRAGADANAVGDKGETPLHVAVGKGNEYITRALLAAGADPNIRSEFGTTPREEAHRKGGDLARLFD